MCHSYWLTRQPVDLRTWSVRSAWVISTFWGSHENVEWLLVLVPAVVQKATKN